MADPFRNSKGKPVWRTGGDLSFGKSDDGRYLVKMGKKTYELFSGDGATDVTGKPESKLIGGSGSPAGQVSRMVQEAMRTAKNGGLIRGAGRAKRGRGRGKMV